VAAPHDTVVRAASNAFSRPRASPWGATVRSSSAGREPAAVHRSRRRRSCRPRVQGEAGGSGTMTLLFLPLPAPSYRAIGTEGGRGRAGPRATPSGPMASSETFGPTFAPAGDWLTTRGTGRSRDRRGHACSDLPPSHEASRSTWSGCLSGSRCRQVFGLASLPVSRVPTAHRFPVPRDQCMRWVSFSLTAAGQPRIHTGFPFKPLSRHPEAPARLATYGGVGPLVNPYLVVLT
jgi:hypothetical protein